MRILMISDVCFPRVNGVSTSIKTFRNNLMEQGHEVTLVAPSYGENQHDDDDVIRIPASKVPFDPEDRFMSGRKIKALIPEFSRRQYDVVHIQTPFVAHFVGVKIARRLDVPVVETYHTYFEEYLYHYLPYSPKSVMRSLARRFTRTQCNELDAVIVPSRAMDEVLRNYGVKTPIQILPTGIENHYVNWQGTSRFRENYGIDSNRPMLVHIGRVAHEKNIDFLLQVVAKLREKVPDILMVIAGEGPALSHLKSLVKKMALDDQVMFVGYLDRDTTLLECYKAGDAFVFASRTETQGLVLLEAMALGVPVVSTAILGTKDILDPGKGCLVAEENVEAFVMQLTRLLTNKVLREELGKEAAEYAKTWSSMAMANRLVDFYQSVIHQQSESVETMLAEHEAGI